MILRLAVLSLLLPAIAHAAPPTVATITPRGLERGKPVTLLITGTNLTPQTRLQLPFPAKQEPIEDPKPNPASIKLLITAEATVPTGIYPIRAVTADGLSGITFLAVDLLPSGNEIEENSTPDKAQPITIPLIVNGLCAGGDVDYFRFAARKGQRLVIETETGLIGSAILPQLRLTDDRSRFLASDDTQVQRGEARMIFDVPADGDYLLEFSDSRYRGGTPAAYRIKIGEYDVVDEIFPLGGRVGENTTFTLRGGTLAKELTLPWKLPALVGEAQLVLESLPLKPGMLAPEIAVGKHPEILWKESAEPTDVKSPLTINGRFDKANTSARIRLPVKPGEKYRFTVQAFTFGSKLDGVLKITDAAGKQLALVDDITVPPVPPNQTATLNPDPSTDLTVPEGTTILVVELSDQRKRGGLNFPFRLTIEPTADQYQLNLATPEVNVPREGSAGLLVNIIRRGYTGPISIRALGLPPGFTAQEGLVPENGTTGILSISASPDAKAGFATFTLEGSAAGEKTLARHVLQVTKDPAAPTIVKIMNEFAISQTSPVPLSLKGPATLEVVKGYPTPIPIEVIRQKDAEKVVVDLSGVLPTTPQVLTYVNAPVAAGVAKGTLTITAPAAAPEGTMTFAVQGKTKIGTVDVLAVSPAFPLTIIRPYLIDGPKEVELPVNQTVPVKFTLKRNGLFKDPVTVTLTGLPAGVTLAEPLRPVPGDQKEFTANLKVGPKVGPATATLSLAATAPVNGAAFVHPPVTVNIKMTK